MADLLIKGMKMPIEGDAVVLVLSKENGIMMAEVDEYCGAVYEAVPISPHGRLIDADELLKRKGDCYDHDGHLLYAVGTGDIMLAPTVIEASEDGEQHGKL